MTVRFHCDAPGCADRHPTYGSLREPNDPSEAPARVAAYEIPGLRDRENPAEHPVIFLPPVGWIPLAMEDGRRLYVCSKECELEVRGRNGRDGTGQRIGATCPACGQALTSNEASGTPEAPRTQESFYRIEFRERWEGFIAEGDSYTVLDEWCVFDKANVCVAVCEKKADAEHVKEALDALTNLIAGD